MKKIIKLKDFWFYSFACLFLIMLGSYSNVFVMEANNCQMPINTADNNIIGTHNNRCYVSFQDYSEVNKGFLGDIISTNKNHTHYSIGDILMFLGALGFTGLFITNSYILVKERGRRR